MTPIVASSTKMDAEKLLVESTQFEVEFILERMRTVSGNNRLLSQNLNSISVIDITGGSAFFARVLKVTFEWNDSTTEPKSVVLKVPHVQGIASNSQSNEEAEETRERENTHLEIVHKREVQFYEHFGNRANGLSLPVFYYGYEYSRTHDNGLLIMEDLTRYGRTINILPGFDNAQIESLIDFLARLAVVSWNDRSWVEPMIVKPPEEQEYSTKFMRTFTLLLKKLDPRFEALVDKLCSLFTTGHYHQTNYKEAKYGFPAALVHGDLWAPNILWKTDENGQATSDHSAVIDWQNVHAGNPLEDFGRLLVLNTTSAYRKANHDRLLKLYISKLREYVSGESPIHEGNVAEAYKASLPYVALFLGFGVPMYLNMPSVVRQDPEHKADDSAELLDRTLCFFEEVVEAYAL